MVNFNAVDEVKELIEVSVLAYPDGSMMLIPSEIHKVWQIQFSSIIKTFYVKENYPFFFMNRYFASLITQSGLLESNNANLVLDPGLIQEMKLMSVLAMENGIIFGMTR